jgi:hypothetical protein
MDKIYTFWEGEMPEYLKLCMNTWHFDYVILNYENLTKYTDSLPEKIKQLSLPKIADYVRVHVLRDNGGYWLDTDTILLNDELPKENILGNPKTRENTIGFLKTEPYSDMYLRWSFFQEYTLKHLPNMKKDTTRWDVMGNAFTDDYLKKNLYVSIGSINEKWAETYMIKENIERKIKYKKFYFENNFSIKDLTEKTNMLMLHNSWTPDWYKKLNKDGVLKQNCTLSNILRELNK